MKVHFVSTSHSLEEEVERVGQMGLSKSAKTMPQVPDYYSGLQLFKNRVCHHPINHTNLKLHLKPNIIHF